MDGKGAQDYVRSLRTPDGDWIDPCHIATCILSDEYFKESALVELWLREPLPQFYSGWHPSGDFEGVIGLGAAGIWYYDGDGDVNESAWRPTLIPWGQVKALRIHRAS